MSERKTFLDLPNLIVISIWFVALYLIFFIGRRNWSDMVFLRATIVVCLISIFMTWYVFKRKEGFSETKNKKEMIPAIGKIEDINNENVEGTEFVTEQTYRKITWSTTIIAIIMFSIFLEYITVRSDYKIALIALIVGVLVFSVPLFVNVKDDMDNIMQRAEKERKKAWRKGKVEPPNGET